MGLFSKKNISVPKRSLADELKQIRGEQVGVVEGNLDADRAFTEGQLGSARDVLGRTKTLQEELNPEMFAAMQRQEQIALEGAQGETEINRRLKEEALKGIGQGLTEDEERGLRESSRSAFTSRGLFRSNPSLVDEIVRRQQGNTQARMRNNMFASGVDAAGLQSLQGQSNLLQQGVQNRGRLFLDPRQSLVDSGVGISGQGLLGHANSLFAANQSAALAEAAANSQDSFGTSLLKGTITQFQNPFGTAGQLWSGGDTSAFGNSQSGSTQGAQRSAGVGISSGNQQAVDLNGNPVGGSSGSKKGGIGGFIGGLFGGKK